MRKKRIVAMALAMSIFASTFGMLGAAAADAEPIEDTTGGSITVTVVPLESAGDTEGEEPKTTETGDEAKDTDTEPGTPAEGEDGDTTDADKEPDYSQIERPGQSDTVETLPGDSKDNEDHIKGEDKADSKDDASEPETPAEGDKDIETPAEGDDKDTTETPAEGDKDTETEPEEPAEDDDIDYDVAYDEDTGHFKVTFNIKEGASGDQTIELSKVQEVISAYGKQAVEEYLKDPTAQKRYSSYLESGQPFSCRLPNGLIFKYYPKTGTANLTELPSCNTVFDVSLSNGSKHTYVYKDNSFTVATPDLTGKGDSGLEGFDGQELPNDMTQGTLDIEYSRKPDDDSYASKLIDEVLANTYPAESKYYYLDDEGNLSKQVVKKNIPADTELVKIGSKYYVKCGDYYYGGFTMNKKDLAKSDVIEKTDADGNPILDADGKPIYVLQNAKTNYYAKAFKKSSSTSASNLYYEARPTRGSSDYINDRQLQQAIKDYLGDKSCEQYILEQYNADNGTSYTSLSELAAEKPEEIAKITNSGNVLFSVSVKSSSYYDNFYKNILSFNVGSEKDMESFLKDSSTGHGNEEGHGNWASDGYNMTIGQYMEQKLNETDGAWEKANSYFQTLRLQGYSEEEATWAAFTMAVNIDGSGAGDSYQNSAWNWYASMVLKQADGTLDLTKTDKDTGKVIKDSETSFYLWKYETTVDKETKEETTSTLYYTYVEPSTDKEGNEVPGYYGWVKYDPDKKNMTYTITTTDGNLHIDYELLENMVYYLQEAVAPDGYDIDTTVYIICNEEDYDQAVSDYQSHGNSAGKDAGITSDSTSWMGKIEGGKTLKIEFVNSKTPTPDPDPTPVDPENPDNPVDPENPDNPPVQDETPDEETPVTPENPSNPPVQDATAELPKTGTSGWMVSLLMTAGFALLAGGWFASRKQYAPKH